MRTDLATKLSDFVKALHGQHVVDAWVNANLVHDGDPLLLGTATKIAPTLLPQILQLEVCPNSPTSSDWLQNLGHHITPTLYAKIIQTEVCPVCPTSYDRNQNPGHYITPIIYPKMLQTEVCPVSPTSYDRHQNLGHHITPTLYPKI